MATIAHNADTAQPLFGVSAEYEHAEQLIAAVEQARAAGYSVMDAYTPIPVHGLYEALGRKRTRLPLVTLLGGVAGALAGFGLQVWVSAVNYPLNIGGRPYISYASFFPVTFECMILGAAIATMTMLFARNGLPQPYHPIFNAPGIEGATNDRFFLCIEGTDPKFDSAAVQALLKETGALNVSEVQP